VALTFHIPGPLRAFTEGRAQVRSEGPATTLRDALELLWRAHPGLRDRVLTEEGQIREHINIFVGNEAVRYSGGLTTTVPAGGEISIIPAISGGCGPASEPSGKGWKDFSGFTARIVVL
jgi:sulfur-carrier protein